MMPAEQRGSVYKTGRGYGLRYYDETGARRRQAGFSSRSEARAWFRDVERPRMRGERVAIAPMTLLELADLYLERHALVRDDRTIRTLRARLRRPLKDYGDTKLDELETMAGDLATWRSTLPPAFAYQVFSALRQVLAAGVRWRYLSSNPAVDAGANPKPKPRAVRVLTLAEIDALDAELGARYGPIVPFAAATSLRPAEWAGLECRDVNRDGRVLTVRGTKTAGSRREVPLSARALGVLDRVPPRLDTPLVFPAPRGGPLDLNRWRGREWAPAVEAAGITKPCRIYDLRSTFASNALAAGVTVFELARVMGTSVAMIEHHYGALIDGAHAGIVGRLDAIETALEEAAKEATLGV
jgi:integrase